MPLSAGREWRIDLHIHTYVSADSANQPRSLVRRARALNLDRIAITDHNRIDGALEAKALAPELVLVGEEIVTAEGGELIAYFVREEIPPRLPIAEALGRLRDQDAVISVSHPMDSLRRSALGEQLTLNIIDQVDALEVFNARCLFGGDNLRAAEMAARFAKGMTAGSDAHTLAEVGRGYVLLPPFSDDPGAFRSALLGARAGGCLSGPWPHFVSSYARLAKRFLYRHRR